MIAFRDEKQQEWCTAWNCCLCMRRHPFLLLICSGHSSHWFLRHSVTESFRVAYITYIYMFSPPLLLSSSRVNSLFPVATSGRFVIQLVPVVCRLSLAGESLFLFFDLLHSTPLYIFESLIFVSSHVSLRWTSFHSRNATNHKNECQASKHPESGRQFSPSLSSFHSLHACVMTIRFLSIWVIGNSKADLQTHKHRLKYTPTQTDIHTA